MLDMPLDTCKIGGESGLWPSRQTASKFLAELSTGCDHKIRQRDHKVNSPKAPLTVRLLPVSKAIYLRGFTVPRLIRFILGERRKPTKEPTDLFGDCKCRVRESLTGQRLGRDKVIGWIRGIRYELSLCIGGQ